VTIQRSSSVRAPGSLLPVAFLCALLCGACAAGPAPRDHFYRIDVALPERAEAAPAHDGILMVERFSSDSLIRGRPILRRSSEDSLEVVPLSRQLWIDSAPVLLQGEMIDYLQVAGVAREVVSHIFRATPDWILRGHINRFEFVSTPAGNRVIVDLELRVSKPRSATALWAGTYRVERDASSGDFENTVHAFSAALTELMADLSEDLRQAR